MKIKIRREKDLKCENNVNYVGDFYDEEADLWFVNRMFEDLCGKVHEATINPWNKNIYVVKSSEEYFNWSIIPRWIESIEE